MVTDQQVRRLYMLINKENTKAIAASKAGMDEKTARRYIKLNKLPTECKKEHIWSTRKDPFEDKWSYITDFLENNSGLEAKTIFDLLQREEPGKFQDGQLRTLQRRVKCWRATEGPAKEVFFPQVHKPAVLCESDFTNMNKLNITITGEAFKHLIYHFVLTYSNWETGTICFSESFESLNEGLQNALWKLGGVPQRHRTDRLSSAVHKECNPEEFTQKYKGILNYYKLKGEKIQAGCPNENGDVEQRHYRFVKAVDQALMLRGSRNFENRQAYESFINKLFEQLNSGRKERLKEELPLLKELPALPMDVYTPESVRVRRSSTINILHNIYSVHSRLRDEMVTVRIYAEYLEVWYAQKLLEKLPRLRGRKKHHIQYRHIIDWLIRKPGAFKDYLYKADLFPSSYFRMAYDYFHEHCGVKADKHYLNILYLAAKESESGVEEALKYLFAEEKEITPQAVKSIVTSSIHLPLVTDVEIVPINLNLYDTLLDNNGEEVTYA